MSGARIRGENYCKLELASPALQINTEKATLAPQNSDEEPVS